MPKQKNSKEAIIDAAEAVVLEAGAAHMSLDEVAKKAGVSKGGLLYHFPSKETLLMSMLERLITQFYADREKALLNVPQGPGRLLKAGILAALTSRPEKIDRMGLAILAAAAYDPNLLAPLQKTYKNHLKELADSGLKFERAAIFSLASDGLMLLELLRLSPYTPRQRNKIKDELISLIDKGDGE